MDASKFIADLLNNKKLGTSHKKKLLMLANKEIHKGTVISPFIVEQLKKMDIELNSKPDALTTIPNEIASENTKEINIEKLKYRHPKNLTIFLTELNRNPILKSTTHSIDANLLAMLKDIMKTDNYDYFRHIRLIKEEYNRMQANYRYIIPIGTSGKLNEFYLFTKDGWSEDNIKIGWSSPEIARWCKLNAHKCPNPNDDLGYTGYELDEIITTSEGKKMGTFLDVINLFKNQIECRDSSFLEKLLDNENNTKFSNLNISIDKVTEGIQFYTDVEKTIQAYNNIIRLCRDEHLKINSTLQYMQIEVGLERKTEGKDRLIVLSIFDKGAVFNKDVQSLFDRYGNTFAGIIFNQINGLCDLELIADFRGGETAKVSVWPRRENYQKLNSKNGGVRFNLIFYLP